MNGTYLRRAFTGSLVLLTASWLPGCGTFGAYQWLPSQYPKCDSITWKQVTPDRLPGLCGDGKDSHSAGPRTSCVLGCLVVSPFSEDEAKHIYTADGNSIWNHEVVGHAILGLKHQ